MAVGSIIPRDTRGAYHRWLRQWIAMSDRTWRRAFRIGRGRRSLERDVDDELAFHLAMREDRLRREGVAADVAHATARERFGDATRVREECLSIDSQYARTVTTM